MRRTRDLTIIDLHALVGGHNCGWHSDNITNTAAFWDHKDFQDRGVWLWEQIAARYKGNAWVTKYNHLNKPTDPSGIALVKYYEKLGKAIRAIDPDHILWLDGNTYACDFTSFTSALPNCVYAIHNYSLMGFPTGDTYIDSAEQKDLLRKQYTRKTEFHREHNTAIWNGEFGPVFADEIADPDNAAIINSHRHALLGEQMKIYSEEQISWTIWLYKYIGVQGMV